MKTVYKYSLDITNEQVLALPVGAVILSVANQHEGIVMYALVDKNVKGLQGQKIYIHGTGHEVYGENLAFIGTVELLGGRLMFHVFREAK